MYSGPFAGGEFSMISVRDFVAMTMVSVLGLELKPSATWNAEKWAELRQKVRTAFEEADAGK